jgi:hypothetical protein
MSHPPELSSRDIYQSRIFDWVKIAPNQRFCCLDPLRRSELPKLDLSILNEVPDLSFSLRSQSGNLCLGGGLQTKPLQFRFTFGLSKNLRHLIVHSRQACLDQRKLSRGSLPSLPSAVELQLDTFPSAPQFFANWPSSPAMEKKGGRDEKKQVYETPSFKSRIVEPVR